MSRSSRRRIGLALLGMAVLGLGAVRPGFGQLSPGKLAEVHAALEGSTNCLECHDARQGVAPALCLECHQILRDRIDAGQGLHARTDYADCRSCHIDHHGREFELVWWGDEGREAFDHSLTGWGLDGAHATLDCETCHRAEHITSKERFQTQGKDLSRTFLGLESSCLTCHHDEHQGQFVGGSCLSCHGMEAWAPASSFDHSATVFPLLGEHARVECGSCHVEQTTGDPDHPFFSRFVGLEFQECSSCHRDPHEGQLGPACSDCHSSVGWSDQRGSRFNHDRTDFPLTGIHRTVACESCHRPEAGRSSLRFDGLSYGRCTDCHADPHEARLGTTCEECHSTVGWNRVDSAAFEHSRTRFNLEGAHREVACGSCHAAGSGFRVARFERCTNCHRDQHAGQFSHAAEAGECSSCHTVDAFSPSSFGASEHSATSFPLSGAHLALECGECHRDLPVARAMEQIPDLRVSRSDLVAVTQFRFRDMECLSCHEDPHRGDVDRIVQSGGCQACHGDQSWSEIRFGHEITGFELLGAHLQTECAACHPPQSEVADRVPVSLLGASSDCAECHESPHREQFLDGGAVADCVRCHGSDTWASLVFDHNTDSAFKLEGAHQRASCASCHLQEISDGPVFIRYKPLPTTCEGCHGG